MTKEDYIQLREPYVPEHPELVFVFESPPLSGKYFYKPEFEGYEPLFDAMMKNVLKIPPPRTKAEGLTKFKHKKFLLIDATYTPVNIKNIKAAERRKMILRDSTSLIDELHHYAPSPVGVILVTATICNLYDRERGHKLSDLGFNVLNRGVQINFPRCRNNDNFSEAVRQVLPVGSVLAAS